MVSKTKSDNSFLVSQFMIGGYIPPFRLDRDNNGGEIMLFVRDDLSCNICQENHPLGGFCVQINFVALRPK